MVKKQISLRISDLTARQLEELAERWGTTQTETITLIVDRIYRQESQQESQPPRDKEAES